MAADLVMPLCEKYKSCSECESDEGMVSIDIPRPRQPRDHRPEGRE
jgi:hypothetical protein